MPAIRPPSTATPRARRTTAAKADTGASPDDPFFRHLVSSMRNGVIAIHRDGRLALINDEACRIFAIAR